MSFDPEKVAALEQAQQQIMNPPVPVQMLHMPVGKPAPDLEKANKKADAGAGTALANLVIKRVGEQAVSMLQFLKNISELSQKGREAFRVQLKANIDAQRAYMEGLDKESYEFQFLKKTLASATVRLSEFVSFSKAVDMGFALDDSETYHSAITAARMFKDAQADNGINQQGPTRRRGRPATPFADKFKKFLAENVTEENHEMAREMFNTWMALQNFGKQAQE